ncbi:MAG TPA: flagellin [Stellaceae bacterium]|nr:flagellin [Stellaceae bacterium]
MTSISTAAENSMLQYYMTQNQSTMNNLNTEISSGVVAQTYSQIAPQASQLTDFRAQESEQQSYINTINTLSTRLSTMSEAVDQINQSVSNFASNLVTDAYNTSEPDVSQQAQELLQQVAALLNNQDGTSYVFGGTDTNTPPVDLSGLPTGAAATLTTPVNGTPASGGYYAGGAQLSPVKIDNQFSLNYGITANDASTFAPIIQVLNFLAQNGPFNSSSPTDQANITQASQMLDQATQSLTNMGGVLGLQQSELNTELTLQQQSLSISQNGVSNILTVNQATAITQLQTLETQMEASYSATSDIQKLSLVNYLSG